MPRRPSRTQNVDTFTTGSSHGDRDHRRPYRAAAGGGGFRRTQRAQSRQRLVKAAGISLAVLGLLAITLVGVTYLQIRAGLSSGLAADPRIREVLDPRGGLSREPFHMLILGSDRRESDEVTRHDTIILARIDMRANTVSMLSLPRDTRVDIPGHGTHKLNAASALGGTSLMIETVRDFTGLPVQHYVEADFRGFKEMVDALGGVWVDVPMRIDDRQAASEFPEARVIESGGQRLDGKHALTFVRARYSLPRQDLDRIENQQLFIRAVVVEAAQERNPLRLRALGNAAAKSLSTDLDVRQLIAVGRLFSGSLDMLDMAVMPGEPRRIDGTSYVVADEDELAETVERMSQGQPMDAQEPETGSPVDRAAVSVTIHNGAGLAGVAGAAAARLKAKGFNVEEVGNAQQFAYDETLVVYHDGAADLAETVVADLGKGRPVPSRNMYSFTTDVLVVVGKDWAER